jgi:quercetin dioxygenase-like cupin family protein
MNLFPVAAEGLRWGKGVKVIVPGGIVWDDLRWEEVKPKVWRKIFVGERLMMILYHFGPGCRWPEEKHEAEQGGYILKGKILLRLPDEGREVVLGPGQGYWIESKRPHAWEVLDEEVILMDIFSPPRIELLGQEER